MEQMKVLLVDDEEELVSTLAKRLQFRGIEAQYVTSGEKAMERLKNHNFDLLVVDLKMPGLNGIEFMRKVKEFNSKIKFIFVTGYSTQNDAEKSLQGGASDFLLKPVSINVLIEKMHLALKNKG